MINEGFFMFRLSLNRVIKILIISDTLLLSSAGLYTPIFAIFLTTQIRNGTIALVGLATAIFLASKTLFLLPISRYIDKIKGQKDDLFCLVFGSILMALVCFLYIFAKSSYHIYLLQALLGLGTAFYTPGWYVLFTRNIDRYHEGMAWVHMKLLLV
jgi:MFS family permease